MVDPDPLDSITPKDLVQTGSPSAAPQLLSHEELLKAASHSIEQGTDIRSRVRDLTLRALRDRRLEPEAIREVLRSVTEGVRRGAERRPHGVRQALSDALIGLDDAMTKAAEAAGLALRELTARGKDLSDHELKQAMENIRKMEDDFLATVRLTAEGAGGKVKQELLDLVSHARRSGTDTGVQVAETLNEFAGRMTTISLESAKVGFEAARDFSARFALLASGILAGLADALHDQAATRK
ncbi:MAG TPA: DUF6781 family protein [Burkholderiales bacterium]|nr:DUF6781 family protein [Burkholderiales bacterium]